MRTQLAIAAERAHLALIGYPSIDRARPLNQRVGWLMYVEMSHHIDASEPDAQGLYEWHYEYDLFRFSETSVVLVARSYTSTPRTAHFLRLEWDDLQRGLRREDFSLPIVCDAIAYLRANGFERVEWLAGSSYEKVPDAT